MIDLAKHDGTLEVRMDLPARGRMVACVVRIDRAGLSVRAAGRRTRLAAPWWKVLRALDAPQSARAKYLADPEGLLADAGNGGVGRTVGRAPRRQRTQGENHGQRQ